ncbi:hypothetical protein [Nocardiopsis sp. MG754419]|uniref:hypothetical protein n=1 Tax=Nocardiopsis sp. MG754419 TaxID=2259865 RepID=UPI001BA48B00|nr:hypothetical protein [Nocardiopsis sp. MG754419]MBR8743861.1 hypothetical protein [Nocardiopsis sp. MG754419]
MESIGVPWFIMVRYLGPPLFLVVVGGALLWWRRPPLAGLAWTALVVNLFAAALPFLWIGVQLLTGEGDITVIGLVMTLLQPAVVVLAWSLLLLAFVLPSRRPSGAVGSDGGEEVARTPENVG